MPPGFDVSAYIGIFLDEAEEQLLALNEGLVILEKEKENPDLLNRIFRAAHTIKGSSASMGFERIATLTHAMENVFDLLRNGRAPVTTPVVDSLLACLDALQVMKDGVATRGEEGITDVDQLCSRLVQVIEGTVAGPVGVQSGGEEKTLSPGLDEIELHVIQEAAARGFKALRVRVTLDSGCQMKAARAYLVFNNLKDTGEIIKTVPPVDDLEAEKFQEDFELLLVTRQGVSEIRDIVESISEIAGVDVETISLPAGGGVEEKAAQGIPQKEVVGDARNERRTSQQTVRVDVQRLENLMNLVGELVIDRTRLARVGGNLKGRMGADGMLETLDEVSTHIGRITGELQEEIMKARMFPIEQVFNRFPRMVRDLAQKAGKEVDFIIEGRETELDRTVIEEIGDPLIHLLRNAVDHGLESSQERLRLGKPAAGRVHLKASHQENQIVITIEDDGRGINPGVIIQKALEKGLITNDVASRMGDREAINFIFAPGFSTAREVSDVSGRGVGMDIVKSHVVKIGGIIDIETAVNKGTRFTIKLPLTLAINRSLLVTLGDDVYAFPLSGVLEILDVEPSSVKRMQNREVILIRGEVLPLLSLGRLLGLTSLVGERMSVVVVGVGEKRVGLVVDSLLGEQEVVIKSLGDYVGHIPGLAGATILGDGKVALILDVRGLVTQRAEVV